MKNYSGPALLLAGERDCFVPRCTQDILRENLSNCTLSILRGVGHALSVQNPYLTEALISDYLAEVESGTWAGDRAAWLVHENEAGTFDKLAAAES